jgi:hypothetical protein
MRVVVTPDILKEAAVICGPDSNFHKILMEGLNFEKEGLTPVYYFDTVLGHIEITTEERVDKKFN